MLLTVVRAVRILELFCSCYSGSDIGVGSEITEGDAPGG